MIILNKKKDLALKEDLFKLRRKLIEHISNPIETLSTWVKIIPLISQTLMKLFDKGLRGFELVAVKNRKSLERY